MSAARCATACSASRSTTSTSRRGSSRTRSSRRLEEARIKAVPTGHRAWHDHRGQRRPSVRDHDLADATSRPTAAARRSPSPTTGRPTPRAATSRSTPCPPTRRPARSSIISAGSTISSSATSASSAIRSSASPKTICGFCASSASTPASAPGEPDAAALDACAAARQRPHGLVARAHRRRAAEAARNARSRRDGPGHARARAS